MSIRKSLPELGDLIVDIRAKDKEDKNTKLEIEIKCKDARIKSILDRSWYEIKLR